MCGHMSDALTSPQSIARWRRILAAILGVASAVFTGLWLAIWVFVILQIVGGVYEGGELIFAGLFLTAPPVALGTLGALVLVGPKQCKVAWISALLYCSPFIFGVVIACVAPLFRG